MNTDQTALQRVDCWRKGRNASEILLPVSMFIQARSHSFQRRARSQSGASLISDDLRSLGQAWRDQSRPSEKHASVSPPTVGIVIPDCGWMDCVVWKWKNQPLISNRNKEGVSLTIRDSWKCLRTRVRKTNKCSKSAELFHQQVPVQLLVAFSKAPSLSV